MNVLGPALILSGIAFLVAGYAHLRDRQFRRRYPRHAISKVDRLIQEALNTDED